MINNYKIKAGDPVEVKSGDKCFTGYVEKVDWDFDQMIYMVNGEWYCASEIKKIKE